MLFRSDNLNWPELEKLFSSYSVVGKIISMSSKTHCILEWLSDHYFIHFVNRFVHCEISFSSNSFSIVSDVSYLTANW